MGSFNKKMLPMAKILNSGKIGFAVIFLIKYTRNIFDENS
jgi:hypothetical protein